MINLLGAVQIASAAEATVLAQKAGLDLKLVADAVASGQAASPQVVRNVRRFVAGDHGANIHFTPALRLKDIEYALRLAKKLGADCPFGEVAADLYRKLCAQGGGRDNESRIIETLRRN
jgi:3-hydroxyisobutyrate dehydrogenase